MKIVLFVGMCKKNYTLLVELYHCDFLVLFCCLDILVVLSGCVDDVGGFRARGSFLNLTALSFFHPCFILISFLLFFNFCFHFAFSDFYFHYLFFILCSCLFQVEERGSRREGAISISQP